MSKQPAKSGGSSPPLLFKHADLRAKSLACYRFSIPGFSAGVEIPIQETDMFQLNFRSDFLAMILIVKGSLSVTINRQAFTANENSLLIMAPDAVKKMVAAEEGTVISCVDFTADFLYSIGVQKKNMAFLEYFSLRFHPQWLLKAEHSLLLQGLIKTLFDRGNQSEGHPHGRELLIHTFYIFLYEMAALSKEYTEVVRNRMSRKETLTSHFAKLVNSQFRTQRNVQAYASQLNISAKYLIETVKEITGKTAGEIIDDLVLIEAKNLLDNPSFSIAQVSQELHFADQSFFGKFFKRHTGLSPKEYRQTL